MTTVLQRPPEFGTRQAVELARRHWGLDATVEALPSERDQNYLLTAAAGRFVLKIAHAGEDPELLACQHELLERLHDAQTRFRFPRLRPAENGKTIVQAADEQGAMHLVRLAEYIDGKLLAQVRPQPSALLRDVGLLMGTVDRVLENYDHPSAHRDLRWDLRHGRAVVDRHLADVSDSRRRDLIARFLPLFDEHARTFHALRNGVIHGDANDWNILVQAPDVVDPLRHASVLGIIDFGDVVHSWIAAEVAIACAYAMLGKKDPLGAAAHVVSGFHHAFPLSDAEIEALFPLIVLRLCTSVVLSAHHRVVRPENTYLSVSESSAWTLLESLARVSPRFAHYTLRNACGLEPCPYTTAVAAWLQQNAPQIAPVLHVARAPTRTGSRFISETNGVETDDGLEWQTIPLGVELSSTPGTAIHAPLGGMVERLDADAVVIRHEVAAVRFWTMLRGMARSSLHRLSIGQPVQAGEAIGSTSDDAEHHPEARLHVQIFSDTLDGAAVGQSMCRPSERAVWQSLCPDPGLLLGVRARDTGALTPAREPLLTRRRAVIGKALSIAYRRPLVIVRGSGQYLFDEQGQPYLDAVNNVAHVGHAHPRVTEALSRQAAILNTNTRYLHPLLIEYAERLTATLPEPLRICYLVCSGSEANELALRMAYAHTGRRDVIVLDGAYHGNTSSLIELSPYKFDGPGGAGKAAHVHVVPAPDGYRGSYRGSDEETGQRYADHVRSVIDDIATEGRGIAAFFAESLPGCAGQIVPPAGFLASAFRHVRAVGGVCVADEVQTGLGRVGTHFWAFQTQDAVPDIVTVGKPIGNGHPLGAVITTTEIAASFANGMEYFNTFGGNPVSCAAGLAVLDVIRDERLQENALTVGQRLTAGLRALTERHRIVGDVRGRGLYIGVELVLDRETLEPAGPHAAYAAERMRDHGILLSTDGPFHNVLKIKPPLVFTEADADRLVATLDDVLVEDALRV